MQQFLLTFNRKLLENKNIWLYGSMLLLIVYLLPLLIYGSNLHFLVFDNLDSNVVWFKILAESGKIFASNNDIIPNMMNGLPRSCYGSEFNVILWLYYFFTPIQAYIINEILIHSVAFLSMYLFLDRYFFQKDNTYKHIYVSLGALYFAILPFWPSGGLSIPLMPLVTYALLNIKEKKDNWKAWLLLILLPLYSSFILVYFFYFFIAGIYFIRTSIINKSFNKRLFFALLLVVILFLLSEYRLIMQMLIEHNFISNRTEYYSLANKSFLDAYRSSLLEFLDGVPHAKGVQVTLLLPLSLFILFLSFIKKQLSIKDSLIFVILFIISYAVGVWDIVLKQIYTLPLILIITVVLLLKNTTLRLAELLLWQAFIALWFGFSFYEGWEAIFTVFPSLEMFNFSRFFFMTEILWALIIAIIIKEITHKIQFSSFFIVLLISIQFFISSNASFFTTKTNLYQLPFHQYYATDLFKEIEKYIDYPKKSYKVISLGLDPAISQFNGFYTLDGYMVNYPLAYKHEFRKIIAKYLDSNHTFYKELYDGWGSKLYLFDNDVQYAYYNEFIIRGTQNKFYDDLNINTNQIKNMGGDYILSAQKIKNPKHYGLSFLKTFTHTDTFWSISLYKVN